MSDLEFDEKLHRKSNYSKKKRKDKRYDDFKPIKNKVKKNKGGTSAVNFYSEFDED